MSIRPHPGGGRRLSSTEGDAERVLLEAERRRNVALDCLADRIVPGLGLGQRVADAGATGSAHIPLERDRAHLTGVDGAVVGGVASEIEALLSGHRLGGQMRVWEEGRAGEPIDQVSGLSPSSPPMPSTSDLSAALGSGRTISVDAVDEHLSVIDPLIEAIECVAEVRANANLYLSVAGESGLGAHRDLHDVLVIQIIGTKRWRLSPPSGRLVMSDAEARVDLPAEHEVIDLTAGEALYLPRSWIHRVEVLGGLSAHLAIGVKRPTMAEVLSGVIPLAGPASPLRRMLGSATPPDRLARDFPTPSDITDVDAMSRWLAAWRHAIPPRRGREPLALANALADGSWRGMPVRARVGPGLTVLDHEAPGTLGWCGRALVWPVHAAGVLADLVSGAVGSPTQIAEACGTDVEPWRHLLEAGFLTPLSEADRSGRWLGGEDIG